MRGLTYCLLLVLCVASAGVAECQQAYKDFWYDVQIPPSEVDQSVTAIVNKYAHVEGDTTIFFPLNDKQQQQLNNQLTAILEEKRRISDAVPKSLAKDERTNTESINAGLARLDDVYAYWITLTRLNFYEQVRRDNLISSLQQDTDFSFLPSRDQRIVIGRILQTGVAFQLEEKRDQEESRKRSYSKLGCMPNKQEAYESDLKNGKLRDPRTQEKYQVLARQGVIKLHPSYKARYELDWDTSGNRKVIEIAVTRHLTEGEARRLVERIAVEHHMNGSVKDAATSKTLGNGHYSTGGLETIRVPVTGIANTKASSDDLLLADVKKKAEELRVLVAEVKRRGLSLIGRDTEVASIVRAFATIDVGKPLTDVAKADAEKKATDKREYEDLAAIAARHAEERRQAEAARKRSVEIAAHPPVGAGSNRVYSGTGAGHWIESVSGNGAIVTLEDGSVWEIEPIDQIDTAIWLPITDIVVIESNSPLFPYLLINKDDGEKAKAKLLHQ